MIVGATELIVSIGTGAPGPHRLVEEDELLDRAAALAAVLGGPADAEPPVGAHLLHDLAHDRADALGVAQLATRLVVEQLVVVRAQLAAQLLFLVGVRQVHVPLQLRLGPVWRVNENAF